jgi:isopenicillin-N epimerase
MILLIALRRSFMPLKEVFQLDPDVAFLNHGSFGATPKEVFDVYQEWQRRLEHQPVKFLGREIQGLLSEARESLGAYLNADKDDLIFVPNATTGVNIVARSLNLKAGDEVLASDHEYGACNNTWTYLSQRQGFTYKQVAVPLPVKSNEEMLETFWQAVTPQTKVIFLSHITSPTAVTFPVAEICKRARKAGVLTLVDGAHAPGQIPLDMQAIDADFYTGNCHKWMCSPKGAGFLFVRREHQRLIEPLIVSWGWSAKPQDSLGSAFLDNYAWHGTQDFSAYLSVPAAIAFQEKYNWAKVREQCHELLRCGLEHLQNLTGLEPAYTSHEFYHQLAISPLPKIDDLTGFKNKLYDDYLVEIPLTEYKDQQFVRISVQGYNTQKDINRLATALQEMTGL